MKITNKFFVIVLLAFVATLVAVVSCKKETPSALLNNGAQQEKAFVVPEVDDMNAYLKDFKQKMQTVTRGEDEMLSLEEAAWHLSSVANYDFCNANVEFTDLLYDTLYYQVDVTNGQVAMSDLNAVYADMADDIDEYYQNLDLQDKHFRFIGTSISESGQVRATFTITYTILDHTWFFIDDFEAFVVCSDFLQQDYYIWNTTAVDSLEYILNILEGREYIMPGEPHPNRYYYVYTMNHVFDYDSYIDPYGSPFYMNSRLYAQEADTYAIPEISFNKMCYCVDSYLGLAFEYIHGYINISNQRPVEFLIEPKYYDNPYPNNRWDIFCHELTVMYGQLVGTSNPIDY